MAVRDLEVVALVFDEEAVGAEVPLLVDLEETGVPANSIPVDLAASAGKISLVQSVLGQV